MCRKLSGLVIKVLGICMLLNPLIEAADPSLVGWWKLDESSGNIAHDSSNYGHDGTIFGDPEWPFHASTADISNGNDEDMFCFWIRIDDEYMKVTATDPKAKKLVVERGFENTVSDSHRKGALVLVPVYLGGAKLSAKLRVMPMPGRTVLMTVCVMRLIPLRREQPALKPVLSVI